MKSSVTKTEQEIRGVIDRWAVALRITGTAAVMSHHGPAFTHFSLALLVVAPADATGFNVGSATWVGPISYGIDELHIAADGAVAFCHGLSRLHGTKGNGSKPDF